MHDLLQQSAQAMAGINFHCSCGRKHCVDINNVRIGSQIFASILEQLQSFDNDTLLLVADIHTFSIAGDQIESLLTALFPVEKFIFPDHHLVPNERAIERLEAAVTPNITAMIVVGSGTLNDITRYVSFKTKIPYIIVCTAPSMDGYASMVSPLITDGVKVTYTAVYPYAIVADIDVMKNAPLHMLHAGLGDIVGKYTALADWKMAEILHGEYYCQTTVELVQKAIRQCVLCSDGIKERSSAAISSIIEGLILSGMCIGMTGSSRPASGAEHLLSHTWDMIGLIHGKETHLHGNQVAIGTELILEIYHYLTTLDIHEVVNSGKFMRFSREKWKDNLVSLFGGISPQIIEKKEQYLNFTESSRVKAIYNIIAKWEQLREKVFLATPSPEDYRVIMAKAGATLTPLDLDLDRETFRLSIIAAKDIRERYGVLQLLEDLGILEETADRIADRYYK